MCNKSEMPEGKDRIAEELSLNTEVAAQVGSTLASVGDRFNARYRRRRQTDESYCPFLYHFARTLSVILLSGWSETLH